MLSNPWHLSSCPFFFRYFRDGIGDVCGHCVSQAPIGGPSIAPALPSVGVPSPAPTSVVRTNKSGLVAPPAGANANNRVTIGVAVGVTVPILMGAGPPHPFPILDFAMILLLWVVPWK